ncbi:MAG: Sapep family Mn(2+)-dependent dipeptidase [Eubacteriales bacterium]|nr:Sapep family Mn(2+)-dependent dipeptidase [Eubacteriales bacterium]
MKENKKLIENYILDHKNDMISDLFELIKIDSSYAEDNPALPYGSGPEEALNTILSIAGQYGLQGVNYDHQVAVIDLNEKERYLDIVAHMDVVPGGDGWTVTEPFHPIEKNGYIYGRGSSDDKGPAIAALYAMKAIKELNIPLKKNARLILGADEECGGEDLDYYYDREGYPTWAFSPDGEFPVVNVEKGFFSGEFHFKKESYIPLEEQGIEVTHISVGEASNMIPGNAEAIISGIKKDELDHTLENISIHGIEIDSQTEGDQAVRIIVRGKGGHASEPERCNNALTALIKVLNDIQFPKCCWTEVGKMLEALFPHNSWDGSSFGVDMEDSASGPLTMSFTMLEYSPGILTGIFDSRVPLCAKKENLEIPVRKKLDKAGFTLNKDARIRKPHYVPENTELVQALLKSYANVFEEAGHCRYSGGGSYLHGLEFGVVFGCEFTEEPTNMHGPDEHVNIDTLLKSAVAYALAIIELCN